MARKTIPELDPTGENPPVTNDERAKFSMTHKDKTTIDLEANG